MEKKVELFKYESAQQDDPLIPRIEWESATIALLDYP